MAEDHDCLFVDEPYIEPDDSQNHLGNEEDIPLIPDDDEELQEPIHRSNSRHLRDKIAPGELRAKVLNVLAAMKTEGINLPIFLDALCWGDESCISDGTIRYARTALMTSEDCYKPPRPSGEQPQAARKPLLDFAVKIVSDAIDREMMVSAFLFLSPLEDLSEEHLTSLDFDELKAQLQELLPILSKGIVLPAPVPAIRLQSRPNARASPMSTCHSCASIPPLRCANSVRILAQAGAE